METEGRPMNKRERRELVMERRYANHPNPPKNWMNPRTTEEWQMFWDNFKKEFPERITDDMREMAAKRGLIV